VQLRDRIDSLIAENDPMHGYAPELYFQAGESALDWIQISRAAAGVPPPGRILDYGCCYGRVLRWMRVAFPDAHIAAADVFGEGPAFCQEHLSADETIVLPYDPSGLDVGKFDLIWVGSVLSHTSAEQWRSFLRLFRRSLTPTGIAVLTTMGQSLVEGGLRPGTNPVRFSPEQLESVLRDYDETGFGWWPTFSEGHGDCVASPEWIAGAVREAGFQIALFSEEAWLGQDVIAVRGPRQPNGVPAGA
jgi:SAM-dependent methyltransferase